ncbi:MULTISPECIES: Na+/H+ antiporter NhaA [Cysteiniphilum]|uniref:Na(+)/H(+) antiporter NhaA n=1 Tax=Cysteiniphilum litorale TaxID=2056700 RepID=A0A8J2Z5G2_9GAMM|nr:MULTISPECIES: Na+/H+ antiporter NhaA [Cysteiniphilum]GGG01652.1 Na(+)/H(+) antiporter NhaA [Cysteiniphilum litorale]
MSKERKLSIEVIGGIILFTAAVAAIVVNNSWLSPYYHMLETVYAGVSIGNFALQKNLVHWINDGFMALYFLLVGLEIKREFVGGTLSSKSNIIIPAIVALFGLLVPALIYFLINQHNPNYIDGWAIPTATDIAFTLGILALLGSRIPTSLKILVTTIAIFDDIAAIVIIAAFYTSNLSLISLFAALICIVVLICMNRLGVRKLAPFMIVGVIMWLCVLQSGVHATLAGVALALTIPHTEKNSPLLKLEHSLNPWIIFMVLPLFAFANAGISFSGMNLSHLVHPVSLGIILGLFLGKQIGIFISLYLFSKTKYFTIGRQLSMGQLYGIGLVCGIGFTMSLFIGTLAFATPELMNMVKVGVLGGSLISGFAGYLVLRKCCK